MRRLLVAALALLLSASPALAETPTERVRAFFGNVNRIIQDRSYDSRPHERFTAMRKLVAEVVDFRNASALALGTEWGQRTRAERDEFTALFTDLLQRSVFAAVGSRAKLEQGLIVTYIAEMSDRDGATVATSVLTRSGGEMAVGYRMLSSDGRWKVYDVVVDGVSLIENYRAQFTKVIMRSSYAGLVTDMRTRIADLAKEPQPVIAAPAPAAAPAKVAAAVAAPAVTPPPAAAPPPSAVVIAPPAPAPSAQPPLVVGNSRRGITNVPPPVIASVPGQSVPREMVPQDISPRREPRAEVRIDPPTTPAPMVGRIEPAEPPRPRMSASVAPTPAPTPPPAARPSASAVAPAETPKLSGFWVQLGAFSNPALAMKLIDAVKDPAVSLLTLPKNPLMVVRVGPFPSREAAAAKMRELKSRGYSGFVASDSK